MTDKLKEMTERLIHCTQEAMADLKNADAKQLGEAVDMIKDLGEAAYYWTITEAMEKTDEKEEIRTVNYYTSPIYAGSGTEPRWTDTRGIERKGGYMYYPTGPNGDTTWGGNMDSAGMMGNGGRVVNYYTDPMMRDPRQGRSPMRRRMYMEGKEAHHDATSQLKELEAYLQELSTDITEMIKDASPEERATLHQKMSMLADKIA